MTLFSRKAAARLAATAGVVLALSAPCVAQSLDRQDGMGRDTQPLVQRLRSGGYVIVVRHGATATNQADTDPFNFNDVTKQRNLNDKGKELAKEQVVVELLHQLRLSRLCARAHTHYRARRLSVMEGANEQNRRVTVRRITPLLAGK